MFYISVFTLLVAMSISGVAAFYSIVGLTTIFPASILAIIIMGVVLELGKITTAIWLHSFWDRAKWWLKLYLSSALLVLIFITSAGIFGFLSKSHIEQSYSMVGSQYEIQVIDEQIERQQSIIDDSGKIIAQMDEAVNILADAQRIRGNEGAIATRERQMPQRNELNNTIDQAYEKIAELNDEKAELQIDNAKVEAEVGPIRYIAELLYTNPDKSHLEEAVRYLIVIIVFVFDPLAICLIIAAVSGFKNSYKNKSQNTTFPEPTQTPHNINTQTHTPTQAQSSPQPMVDQSGWLGRK